MLGFDNEPATGLVPMRKVAVFVAPFVEAFLLYLGEKSACCEVADVGHV